MALKIDSKIPHIWLTKGEILLCLDKKKDALNAFNEALKLDPDYEEAEKSREELLAKIN